MLLDYAETYPNAILYYKSSKIVLHVDLYATYITMPESIICYVGHFYLRDWTSPSPIKPNPDINGPVYTECKIIRNVVSLAAEYETCGTFNNGKKFTGIRPVLITLDH